MTGEGWRKPSPLLLSEPLRYGSEGKEEWGFRSSSSSSGSDDFLLFPLTESHFLLFSQLTGCRPAASLFNSGLFPALTGSQMGSLAEAARERLRIYVCLGGRECIKHSNP